MPDVPLPVVAAALLAAGVLLPRARPWLLRRRVVRDLARTYPDEARSIRRQLRRRQAWHPARDAITALARAVGPVRALDTPLGRAWRLTRSTGGPRMLSDTSLDRDGWTFVVGVLSPQERHVLAVEVLDDVLTTWRWLPTEPDPAPPR